MQKIVLFVALFLHLAVSKKSVSDSKTIAVCGNDGFPCKCVPQLGEHTAEYSHSKTGLPHIPFPAVLNCEGENLKTTNINPNHGENGKRQMIVTEINMRQNKLHGLYNDQIFPSHVRQLKVLDVSQNEIKFIAEGAFHRMTSLQVLNLSTNHLEHLSEDMFDGLDFSLLELDLSDNQLTNLSSLLFENLFKLRYLNLDSNPIRFLGDEIFAGLNSIVELSMDNTELEYIGGNAFVEMNRLESFSLKNTRLLVTPSFHRMTSLTNLDISENPMLEINSHAFQGLNKLQRLTIRAMPDLWGIEDCAFCGLHKLKQIQINDCPRLYFIDSEAFGQKHYFESDVIELVDLARNSLTSLDKDLLPWENVSTIILEDNPFHCDCSLLWMTNPKLKFQGDLPRCATPANLEGTPVNQLKYEQLCVSYSSYRFQNYMLTVVFLLASALSLLIFYVCQKRRHFPKSAAYFFKTRTPYSTLQEEKIEKAEFV